MANRKTYYYVLVFTQNGPVYVTSVDNATRVAHWDKDKNPLSLPKQYAEDLALGLSVNGYNSVLVFSRWEQYQPYNYKHYDLCFTEKAE